MKYLSLAKRKAMQTIDIEKLIESLNLDKKEVASLLFPTNSYPVLALGRVIAGKAVLDANQISKLAAYCNVPIDALFTGSNWSCSGKKGLLVFETKEYRAELNTKTWITRIFHNDSLKHEAVIHDGATPISSYLDSLDELVQSWKS